MVYCTGGFAPPPSYDDAMRHPPPDSRPQVTKYVKMVKSQNCPVIYCGFLLNNWSLACIYWSDITSSLPVINEDQAREALLQYVAQNCCYGSGAAKNMTFRDLKSSSAFHVCMP